ncbi:MAG: NADP-dependent phosphogluconate dehydrogenase [Ferruginibacter sp.]
MKKQEYDFGMIGLGTMGRNLVYNINDHGYSVAGFDKSTEQVDVLNKEAASKKIFGTSVLNDFIDALKQPRVIMLLVPAGPIVDSVVAELKPFLSNDDLIMDCGNSHFVDTDRRNEQLAKEKIHFMGVGVSGGESGARFGPSIMPGGNKGAYDRIADMLKAVSAKVNGDPCVTYIGSGSAGHYVKMVHNGIEYALMQLLAESYQLLKDIVGLNNDELHEVYNKWNKGIIQSFLVEITADIFKQDDELTKNRLVDMILDAAGQKGTGAWTSESAMELLMPIPAIDTAVSMRYLSAYKADRIAAEKKLKGPDKISIDKKTFIDELEQAIYFAMITTYAQGLALLGTASKKYNYGLQLNEIAAIWRGGCIIRAGLLEDIRAAYAKDASLINIMVDDAIAIKLDESQTGIRKIVAKGIEAGIPLPVLSVSLVYYDSYRHGSLPSNLLQAQRDYFGAHTYKRIDREGTFHTHWNQTKN